jgi:uncharacterized protein YraI
LQTDIFFQAFNNDGIVFSYEPNTKRLMYISSRNPNYPIFGVHPGDLMSEVLSVDGIYTIDTDYDLITVIYKDHVILFYSIYGQNVDGIVASATVHSVHPGLDAGRNSNSYAQNQGTAGSSAGSSESKPPEPAYAYVTANGGLRLRFGPGTNFEVLTTIPDGTRISLLDSVGAWVRTEYDGKDGWVSAEYLTDAEPAEQYADSSEDKSSEYAYVAADGGLLRLRSGPGTNFEVLAAIPDGTRISLLDSVGAWVLTEYDGKSGWVSAEYLTDAAPAGQTGTPPARQPIYVLPAS